MVGWKRPAAWRDHPKRFAGQLLQIKEKQKRRAGINRHAFFALFWGMMKRMGRGLRRAPPHNSCRKSGTSSLQTALSSGGRSRRFLRALNTRLLRKEILSYQSCRVFAAGQTHTTVKRTSLRWLSAENAIILQQQAQKTEAQKFVTGRPFMACFLYVRLNTKAMFFSIHILDICTCPVRLSAAGDGRDSPLLSYFRVCPDSPHFPPR